LLLCERQLIAFARALLARPRLLILDEATANLVTTTETIVQRGIRESRFSLKNCVDCHAGRDTGSVLGKDGFCSSCHAYAAVSMDCFSCHSSSPEKEAMPRAAAPGRGQPDTLKAGVR
jgi:hypothetical protein